MAQKISSKKNNKEKVSKGKSTNKLFDREKLKKKTIKQRARMLKFIKTNWPNYKKDTLLGKKRDHIEIEKQYKDE